MTKHASAAEARRRRKAARASGSALGGGHAAPGLSIPAKKDGRVDPLHGATAGDALAEVAATLESRAWFVARVRPRRELDAIRDLGRCGVFAWTPMRGVWRRANRFCLRKRLVRFPAAPGYVVVGLDPAWLRWVAVLGCEEVAGLVGGDQPRRLSTAAVTAIAAMSDDAPAVERFMASRYEFRVGKLVEVRDGPLSGLVGIVTGLDGAEARLLVTMFGAEREAVVASSALAAVA